MSFGKKFTRLASIALALVLAGCGSSSSGGGGGNAIVSAVQDLGADPDGLTTTITFAVAPGVLTTANFESDGTPIPVTVIVAGTQATVTWDVRISPADSIRAVGIPGVSGAFVAIATSDATAPTFTITAALQNPGLGTDTLEITFAGPRVVQALAEDPDNWELTVNSQTLDLTGSTFVLDTVNQVLDVTLGSGANLHAAFTLQATGVTSVADVALAAIPVVGAATGDTTAPTLVSAAQNLVEDEYGRVVDFTFDEAMDPVFSTGLARFGVPLPEVATSVVQVSDAVLRVTFSGPVIPGVDDVTLNGLVDAHGNAYPNGPEPVTQPSPVANSFDGLPLATTVENALNDVVVVVTTQAFEPAEAIDPANWTLTIDSTPIDLSLQTLEYDFLAKTLTITLDFDMQNGDSFDIAGNVLEVDGETFGTTYIGGVVGGDAAEPAVSTVQQNRTVDPTGKTIDALLSEDVDSVAAQNTANWGVTGGISVLSAVLQPSQDIVRLTLNGPAVPGDVTVSADALEDLAGNVMSAAQTGITVTSSDVTPPSAVVAGATATEGALNDTVIVLFNDSMIEAEVEDPANWTIESPVGNALTVTGATISYNPASQRTTLTFDAGTTVNFQRGDGFSVLPANMRDVGGNAVSATPVTGNVVAETNLPHVHSIFRDALNTDQVVVRFTEPCGHVDDLYDAITNIEGSRYVLRTSGGVFVANATALNALDNGLGVEVSFGVLVGATDTIDVIGVQDLAGNPLFPELAVATVAEDANQPSLDSGLSTFVSISGESNDLVTIVFDRPMSPWQLTNPANYVLDPGTPFDLSSADFTFDGDRTVTIKIKSRDNLQTGAGHDLTINNLFTAQGIQRTVADTELGIVATGDVTLPTILANEVKLDPQNADSLLIEVDEAIDKTAAETAGTYDYNGGNFATSAVLLSPRTVRATFGVALSDGLDLDLTVTDLAGNVTGVLTRTVAVADTAPPIIVPPVGVSVAGAGGDYVVIGFNEPVDPAIAINVNNYAIHNGRFLDLTNAFVVHDSSAMTATIRLPAGQELWPASLITATITNIADLSGNALAGPVVAGGSVSGDTTPPSFASAFANYRQDAGGLVIDVLFDEDVDATFVENETNWSASGGQNVVSATLMNPNFVRVLLDAPLLPSETLDVVSGLTDVAQNAAGAPASVTPEL